jgi:rod shape-determining protein MreC
MFKLLRIITTYKEYFIFVALILISVSLISVNTSNEIGGFRTIAAATFGTLRNLFSWIPDITNLQNENKELLDMNTKYFTEITKMRRAIQENNELRNVLELQKSYKHPLIVCDVYDKNSIQLRNYIVLNKGTLSGINVGMPVISLKGLVGSVIRCSEHYSVVEAINSKNVKIPAKLSKSKINGIVAWNNDEYLYMQYISTLYNVEIGEEVYTSVLNSKYPEDLLIGNVVEVFEEPGTYFHRIIIKPANTFFDYRQLLVIQYIKDEEKIKLIEQVENRLLELNKKRR